MRHVNGFTLIEALIAMLLVLIGLTGAARLQATLLAASADAKASDEATAFALDKLAEFQSIHDLPAYRNDISNGDAMRQGLLHRYAIDWQVARSLDPDFKRVDIRVQWPAEAPVRTLQIQSLIPALDTGRFARQQLQP